MDRRQLRVRARLARLVEHLAHGSHVDIPEKRDEAELAESRERALDYARTAEGPRGDADQTDGRFYSAATEGQLTEVYENIGSSVGYETEQREISTWFIAGALVLSFAAAGFSLLWFHRLP